MSKSIDWTLDPQTPDVNQEQVDWCDLIEKHLGKTMANIWYEHQTVAQSYRGLKNAVEKNDEHGMLTTEWLELHKMEVEHNKIVMSITGKMHKIIAREAKRK